MKWTIVQMPRVGESVGLCSGTDANGTPVVDRVAPTYAVLGADQALADVTQMLLRQHPRPLERLRSALGCTIVQASAIYHASPHEPWRLESGQHLDFLSWLAESMAAGS